MNYVIFFFFLIITIFEICNWQEANCGPWLGLYFYDYGGRIKGEYKKKVRVERCLTTRKMLRPKCKFPLYGAFLSRKAIYFGPTQKVSLWAAFFMFTCGYENAEKKLLLIYSNKEYPVPSLIIIRVLGGWIIAKKSGAPSINRSNINCIPLFE